MRKTARINRTDFPDGAFQMTKAAAEVVTEKPSEAAGLLTNLLLFCWLVTSVKMWLFLQTQFSRKFSLVVLDSILGSVPSTTHLTVPL